MHRLITLIFILLVSINVSARLADLQGMNNMPVEWQAIKLQENIEEKIKRSLNPIIKDSEYVIEVKIGVDLDKVEDPTPKKLTKTNQKKKVQFSTNPFPKEGDDFVVFNKLGLEAPIVGEEPVESANSEVELAQKAIIEMNDRYNLFNYLNTIDIKLTFDKSLPDKTKTNIKKIVEGLSFNTKDILPQINIQYLEMKDPKLTDPKLLAKNAPNASNENPSLGERFKHLDIMIGLIIAAILLGLAAMYIAYKGSKVEQQQETKNENQNNNEGSMEEKVEEMPSTEEPVAELPPEEEILSEGDDMLDLTKTDPQTERINEGLERFRKVMTHHQTETFLLVKGWIKVGKGQEAQALKALVQILTDAELADIFKAMTIDERSSWKMILDGELNKEELSRAFMFISHSIMQMMMVPSLIDDYEIMDMFLVLSADDAAKFCMEHPELGVVFTNVLSSKVISDMFKVMPVEVSADIIERSTLFRKEEILGLMPLLKDTMKKVKDKRERPPFLKRILDILPTARPEIEKKLYATLLKHLSVEDVCEAAVKILPNDLLGDLPDSIYKACIEAMPIDTQVQYFIAQEDRKDFYLDRFASKGSKSREMIDIEINGLMRNEIMTRKIIERKALIDQDFLKIVRGYLATHPETQKDVQPMMITWLESIKKEDSSFSLISNEDSMAA